LSHSLEFLSLLGELLDRLADTQSGFLNHSVLIDLASQYSQEQRTRLWNVAPQLPVSLREKSSLLSALAAGFDEQEEQGRLAEVMATEPLLRPYFQSCQLVDLVGEGAAESSQPERLLSESEVLERRYALLRSRVGFLTAHGIAIRSLPVEQGRNPPVRSLRWRVTQLAEVREQSLLLDVLIEVAEELVLRSSVQSTRSAAGRPHVQHSTTPLRYSLPMQMGPVSGSMAVPIAVDSSTAGDGPDEAIVPEEIPSRQKALPLSLSVEWEDVEDVPYPNQREAEPAVVSTGFAPRLTPADPLSPQQSLEPGARYWFWLQIGAQVAQSIEQQTVSLPKEYAKEGVSLKVVLFAFPGELILHAESCVGELLVQGNGAALVVKQPCEQRLHELSRQRLFFPVQIPERATAGATLSLRCNIYCNQVLLQSRLVSVEISDPQRADGSRAALRSFLDYSIADQLGQPASLHRVQSHSLSLLLNDNSDGTHSFRFFGSDGKRDLRHEATLDDDTLRSHVKYARGALRKAAWGDEEAWRGTGSGQSYRYAEQPRAKLLSQLFEDLIPLAVSGSRFYVGIARHLVGSVDASYDLQSMMRSPGFVQIASKVTASHILPAALLYDQPLDDGQPASAYKICPAFRAALESAKSLEQSECFAGRCPSYDSDTIICPSGFWGFRHYLGMPLSGPNRTDPQPEILYEDGPHLSCGISLELREFSLHEKALKALRKDLVWQVADSASAIFQMMRAGQSHVVYFYCHGGVTHDMPYLEVGKSDVITPSSLFSKRIRWKDPRPLVFLNGCHTTALGPEQVMDLVTEFIEVGQATGVIGTEITIFEPLARAFAEECLGRFLSGQAIGQAIRGARLGLLKAGNPLGLCYDPFVLATVTLAKKSP